MDETILVDPTLQVSTITDTQLANFALSTLLWDFVPIISLLALHTRNLRLKDQEKANKEEIGITACNGYENLSIISKNYP